MHPQLAIRRRVSRIAHVPSTIPPRRLLQHVFGKLIRQWFRSIFLRRIHRSICPLQQSASSPLTAKSGNTQAPTLAVKCTSCPSTEIGAAIHCTKFCPHCSTSAMPMMSGITTANSSPPTRATVSELRTARFSRSAISTNTLVTVRVCPSESFNPLQLVDINQKKPRHARPVPSKPAPPPAPYSLAAACAPPAWSEDRALQRKVRHARQHLLPLRDVHRNPHVTAHLTRLRRHRPSPPKDAPEA